MTFHFISFHDIPRKKSPLWVSFLLSLLFFGFILSLLLASFSSPLISSWKENKYLERIKERNAFDLQPLTSKPSSLPAFLPSYLRYLPIYFIYLSYLIIVSYRMNIQESKNQKSGIKFEEPEWQKFNTDMFMFKSFSFSFFFFFFFFFWKQTKNQKRRETRQVK